MTSHSAISGITTLIDRYIAIWNETDPAARRSLIDSTWAEHASYADPVLAGTGRDGTDGMVAGFQEAYPGHTFDLAGENPLNEATRRFGWRLLSPTGEVQMTGEDVYEPGTDGLVQSIVGTFNQS